MKFLIIGDLHGRKPKIHFKDFDAIIAPGDFCSDELRKYLFLEVKIRMKNPKAKTNLEDIVGRKKLKRLLKRSFDDGRKILKKLNSFGVPVYVIPGNWESDNKKYKRLIKGLKNIVDCHHKIVNARHYSFIGHGFIAGPEFPQHRDELKGIGRKGLRILKKEYMKDYRKVHSLFKKAKKPVIFLSHNVPFNTPLDKIVNPQSPRHGLHYGSVIARKIIDRHQPLLCIGGHMHEHFKEHKMRKTTAINAGFGPKVNILLDLDGNRIKKMQFYPRRYG